MRTNIYSSLLIAGLLVAGAAPKLAADTHQMVNTPGFRPESQLAETFLKDLDSTRIVVLPAVIRTRTATSTLDAPQKAVAEFLSEHKFGIPEVRTLELEVGELEGQGQYQWFQHDAMKLGEIVKTQSGTDYFLALEYLIPTGPSGDIAVFGIHVYVLDAEGENAFSFLLNSHHEILVDAQLTSADSSERGYEALALKATPVALDALSQQITQARKSESL